MLVSTRGRYALRVLADMAERQAEGYLPLKEIAQRQEISEKYLESIVKTLVKGGVLTGLRGKGGGYRLSGPPEELTVGAVLRLTEGTLFGGGRRGLRQGRGVSDLPYVAGAGQAD